MVHAYSFFGSTADFVIKKGTFGIFTGFCHLQTSETSGRNMAVELDSRHLLLPKTGWENEDLTLILRGKKWKFLQILVSAFNVRS
jgi:phosphatidylserine decarboxylase